MVTCQFCNQDASGTCVKFELPLASDSGSSTNNFDAS